MATQEERDQRRARGLQDSKVVIRLSGHGRGEVLIDGVKLPNVRAVKLIAFDAEVGKVNRLTVELLSHDVEIEGPAEVVMRLKDQVVKIAEARPSPPAPPPPTVGELFKVCPHGLPRRDCCACEEDS